jgi:transcription antitermination factor NusB
MAGEYFTMNRHELREKAMITVYQYLLVERNIDELIEDTFEAPKAEIDPYFIEVIEQSISNIDRYQSYIDKVLVDWKFDRLGKIEQAILLNGCSEFDLKKTEAAVIIDESVQLAKKYCDADTYKLINSVLDVI